jgi:NAD+ synthase
MRQGRGIVLTSEFDLDWDRTVKEITAFIQKTVRSAGANGAVVGLSGGIDSSLVAKLLVMALGHDKVLGVSMPASFTPRLDVEDAEWLAKELQIKFELVEIQPIVDRLATALQVGESDSRTKIPMANLRSRARMIILYYFANLNNLLVAGTGDRSEDLIGYFTKYGDGGVDFLPISHLYKTQVRRLAEHLGLPSRIVNKPSSPQLYPGHKATDEIPLDYDGLDRVLKMLFDEHRSSEDVADTTKVDLKIVEEVLHRFRNSAHKRSYPLMVRGW